MRNILVTGAEGQLGLEFKAIASKLPSFTFVFANKAMLDISSKKSVTQFFTNSTFNYCINCAAYTAVDKAETEQEQAFAINSAGVGLLAGACKKNKIQLIHISTDYVFNGKKKTPYVESDKTNPIGAYGKSKLSGEEMVLEHCPSAVIIRTSWLYSSYRSNFVKTMLRLMQEKESINVVNDQFGSPTYAGDLAMDIMQMIRFGRPELHPGIYHYSNSGIISWFEFATAIKNLTNSKCEVKPVTTAEYPTATKRPAYSALNTDKFQNTFGLSIRNWKDALRSCLAEM